ncbi:MAG: hypothetical protein NZ581_06175 [Candidatus Caldarchaeum sp.]|nr:hypothetical protein [Candidatus Caldarchaeum sp.]MDW8435768.1 hypothetical protein [Candidatus Caldarchaeum sp.]
MVVVVVTVVVVVRKVWPTADVINPNTKTTATNNANQNLKLFNII